MHASTLNPPGRIVYLDFIRVISCLMVVLVHSCEFFYPTILAGNSFWLNLIDSALRACVPLFVMVSSYLLLPLRDHETPGVFYKRRFMRVLIPFLIWSVLYATVPSLWGEFDGAEVRNKLVRLLYNFNMNAGHLWFVYMLIGVYLIMPVISPWLKTVSKRFEQVFLVLWFATTFYHYVKLLLPEILGECVWNEFTPFWYVSGYIGYVVLAHYIRMHVDWSVRKSVAVGLPLYLVGYVATFFIFDYFTRTSVEMADWERGWRFCTPNVALMTAGLFIMMKKIRCRNERVLRVVNDMSKLSYGIYLMHIFVLNAVYWTLSPCFGSIPLTIFVVGIVTFVLCYALTKLISCLPGSRYLIG
ncbi:MAG: acyltransferase family protein [Rikenellaceae bacterium]|nr:acyltransferase family protein [Rikenellaceae bacterium]